MISSQDNPNTTLDELAAMVARGFEDVMGRMATKDDIAQLKTQVDSAVSELKEEILSLSNAIAGLRNELNNYLRLTDDRYLELKHRQDVLAGWMLKLANKNQIQIDLKELDYKA
jgi:uncharacterized protein YPO0396